MAASKDSAKMENIFKGSDFCVESGGRITFYSNTTKNKPMWNFFYEHLNLCKTLRSEDASKWESQCKRNTTCSWPTVLGN